MIRHHFNRTQNTHQGDFYTLFMSDPTLLFSRAVLLTLPMVESNNEWISSSRDRRLRFFVFFSTSRISFVWRAIHHLSPILLLNLLQELLPLRSLLPEPPFVFFALFAWSAIRLGAAGGVDDLGFEQRTVHSTKLRALYREGLMISQFFPRILPSKINSPEIVD